jgi:hypothetical protein
MRTIENLLPKLITATEDDRVVWHKSGFAFEAGISGFKVRVWQWHDENSDSTGYTVQLLSADDVVLDDIRANEYSANFTQLEELHGFARRSYNGVDEIIGKLVNAL